MSAATIHSFERAGKAVSEKTNAMIGVACKDSEQTIVREFFELFKTPWEFLRPGERYDVLLSTTGEINDEVSRLVLIYSSATTPFDTINEIQVVSQHHSQMFRCQDERIPIYGNNAVFVGKGITLLVNEATQKTTAFAWQTDDTTFVRVGFDLFGEVRSLLEKSQPTENAQIPTLELHIALLRDLILNSSLPVIEIPPVPADHEFIACLTHDMDHPSIRLHRFDHTLFGFLYRAVVESLVFACRGRISAKKLVRNWFAALKLPFVHLGLARDFWLDFDQYLELERGLGSTFYFIPCKDHPGSKADGRFAPQKRSSRYAAAELSDRISSLLSAGSEIGLHGIDAWIDSDKGSEELQKLSVLTNSAEIGVRMHWLYYDEASPLKLERAGFSYDSTAGYNETVGFRNGTTQAFKPLGVSHLLELPLNIMDTAMFFPVHMSLTESQAKETVERLIAQTARFGGVLTINWHDRSIAPERLWGDFYAELINGLKRKHAWFPTSNQAVSWFRKRRRAVIQVDRQEDDAMRVKITDDRGDDALPALRIRTHKPRGGFDWQVGSFERSGQFKDMVFKGDFNSTVD